MRLFVVAVLLALVALAVADEQDDARLDAEDRAIREMTDQAQAAIRTLQGKFAQEGRSELLRLKRKIALEQQRFAAEENQIIAEEPHA